MRWTKKLLGVAVAALIILSVVILYNTPIYRQDFFIYEFTGEETKLIPLDQEFDRIEILDWNYTKTFATETPPEPTYVTTGCPCNNQPAAEVYYLDKPYEYELLKTGTEDTLRLFIPKIFFNKENNATYRYVTNYLKLTVVMNEKYVSNVFGIKADPINPQNPDYEYVIITNETFWPIFNNDFKAWKITTDPKINNIWIVNVTDITDVWRGFTVNDTTGDATSASFGNHWIPDGKEVTSDWSIFNDTQAQIRNFIRDCYDNENTRYVLLGGNKNIVPPRMACSNASGSACLTFSSDTSHASDMYYSNLHYSMNNNTNSYWMENECCGRAYDEIDWGFDLCVGRALCGTTEELHNWINKTKAYVDGNSQGNYLKNNIVACKDGSNAISNQSWTGWWEAGGVFGPGLGDEFPSNMTFVNNQNITQEQWIIMNEYCNGGTDYDGINIIYHTGHDGTLYNTFGGCYQPGLLLQADKPQFVYTEGCHTGNFGEVVNSKAEIWMSYNGTYAEIVNSAYGWFVASTYFGEEMFSRMFNTTRGVNEKVFCQAHNDARETIGHSDSNGVFAMICKETNFFGDPSLYWVWYDEPYTPQTDGPTIISVNLYGNQTTISDSTPTFNWTLIANASNYNLLISTDSTFTTLTVNLTDVCYASFPAYYSENETQVSFTLPEAYKLHPYDVYYVKVKARTKNQGPL